MYGNLSTLSIYITIIIIQKGSGLLLLFKGMGGRVRMICCESSQIIKFLKYKKIIIILRRT